MKIESLINFSIVSVYIYSASVVAQLGYLSFFGIPYDFIETSFQYNVIILIDVIKGFFTSLKETWPTLLFSLLILLILIAFLLFSGWIRFVLSKGTLVVFLCVFLIASFQFWYDFGSERAMQGESVYALDGNCGLNSEKVFYVIPAIYNESALLVPIDPANDVMFGGFRTLPLNELPCEIIKTRVSVHKQLPGNNACTDLSGGPYDCDAINRPYEPK